MKLDQPVPCTTGLPVGAFANEPEGRLITFKEAIKFQIRNWKGASGAPGARLLRTEGSGLEDADAMVNCKRLPTLFA